MPRARWLTLLRQWSADPIRTTVLLALTTLLAGGGPLACWLHCQHQAGMSSHGSHHAASPAGGAVAAWARAASARLPASDADDSAAQGALLCSSLHEYVTALTVGLAVLPLLLVLPGTRPGAAALRALPAAQRFDPPRHPPPRGLVTLQPR